MKGSANRTLIFGVSTFAALSSAIAFLLLSPSPERASVEINTVKDFGAFIERNPQLVHPPPELTKPEPGNSKPIIALADATASGLSAEQESLLKESFNEWSRRGSVRDARWRTQVETVLTLAEATGSTEALDYLKPQIINARYDQDEQNQAQSKFWTERYLRIEKRNFQRLQMQALLEN